MHLEKGDLNYFQALIVCLWFSINKLARTKLYTTNSNYQVRQLVFRIAAATYKTRSDVANSANVVSFILLKCS